MNAEEPTLSDRLRDLTTGLMEIPGLAGHEGRVRQHIAATIDAIGCSHRTDRLGNLIVALNGNPNAPSVMIIAHMDQLGFVVRKIEPDGYLRVERLGGVPEKALPSKRSSFSSAKGATCPASSRTPPTM